MKILCLGDIVSDRTVELMKLRLPQIIKDKRIDFTVVNGENANMGKGNGLTPEQANTMLFSGADVITGGNHTFSNYKLYQYLDSSERVIRPCNKSGECPGSGYTIVDGNGRRILVINVLGRVYLPDYTLSSPFNSVEKILDANKGEYDISILDIHAEATSEKFALASYFDGRIDIIFGTHTHVATADERILPKGSGFITDIGMCGPENSALGVDTDIIIRKFTSGLPSKFEVSKNDIVFSGAIFILYNNKLINVDRIMFI